MVCVHTLLLLTSLGAAPLADPLTADAKSGVRCLPRVPQHRLRTPIHIRAASPQYAQRLNNGTLKHCNLHSGRLSPTMYCLMQLGPVAWLQDDMQGQQTGRITELSIVASEWRLQLLRYGHRRLKCAYVRSPLTRHHHTQSSRRLRYRPSPDQRVPSRQRAYHTTITSKHKSKAISNLSMYFSRCIPR